MVALLRKKTYQKKVFDLYVCNFLIPGNKTEFLFICRCKQMWKIFLVVAHEIIEEYLSLHKFTEKKMLMAGETRVEDVEKKREREKKKLNGEM